MDLYQLFFLLPLGNVRQVISHSPTLINRKFVHFLFFMSDSYFLFSFIGKHFIDKMQNRKNIIIFDQYKLK